MDTLRIINVKPGGKRERGQRSCPLRKRDVIMRHLRGQLTLNSSKCVLGAKQVKVLGFVVGETGVRVDPQRIAHILEIEKPKTGKDLSSIL
eukprot:Pgem_evm1s19504